MALSKPLSFLHLRTLTLKPYPIAAVRLLSFATPEEAAAERRRRKRQLRIEPPLSSLRQRSPPQQRQPRPPAPNPNAPKIPEAPSALSGKRLDLHNRILNLIRSDDLDEATLLVRHSIYSNCRPTIFTCNAVLNGLLRRCRYSDLLSLHRFITQASVAPTIATHNLLIQAYCDCRKTDAALDHYRLVFTKEDSATITPSPTTYRILVKGLVDNNKLEQAVELKDAMLCDPDPAVYNILMSGFVKTEDSGPDRVISLYEELKEKLGGGAIHDGVVYGNLMKGYFKKGMDENAMEVYNEVLGEESKVRFGAVNYNSVLDALCKHGRLDEAIGLFDRMMQEHAPPRRLTVNLGSFNVMVDGYCLAGRFDDAVTVFRRMGEKKCAPDALSFNNLIDQLGKNRLVAEAEEIYREMGGSGVSPDEYTYVLLIEACFGVGRMDDATGYFRKMVEVGLRPNAASYNKVIDGLVKVTRVDEAKGFFDMMVEKEVKPNVLSYELLVRAFLEDGRLDDALKMLRDELMDEGVSLSSETKELVEEALKKEGREEELERLFEDVEREKAEIAARIAEEKARAEALAKEEEERKKAEAAAKEEAAAKASKAAIEAVLGRNKSNNKEESKEEPTADGASAEVAELIEEAEIEDGTSEEANADNRDAVDDEQTMAEAGLATGSEEETKVETGNSTA